MAYTIGQVADLVGMTVEGLRFYERRGLLRPARRSAAGYRLYEESQIDTLRFVRAAQQMGLSLREITDLLALRNASGECAEVREQLSEALRSVRERLRLLEAFESQLQVAVERCGRQLAAGMTDCPVLTDLGSGLGIEQTTDREKGTS